MGSKSKIQKFFGRFTGANRQQEEIDTLYYFLNNYTEITKLGPTKDEELRMVQLCCTEFLAIFDAVCEKYNLTYWLDAGTLLGAIRHNGFIPWDDDVDVAMLRSDYDKLLELTKDEMAKYNIDVRSGGFFDDRGPLERLAFAYKTLETGCWIDVFPIDSISTSLSAAEIEDELKQKRRKSNKAYTKHKNKKSLDELTELRKIYISGFPKGDNVILFDGPEFSPNNCVVSDKKSILPLIRHKFEQYEFPVPNNYSLYLSKQYGKNYMSFPRNGVEHHLDTDGNSVKTRAERTGTDMNKELKYLQEVKNKIKAK